MDPTRRIGAAIVVGVLTFGQVALGQTGSTTLLTSTRAPADPLPAAIETEPPRPVPLILRLWDGAEFELTPDNDEGGFDEHDLDVASDALACKDGTTHPIHPRLLDLVYQTMRHFDVPFVHVVSGYRHSRKTSRHTQGRAIDMQLPGVNIRRLATYMRTLGFVGVGIYPRSGFVHLDVRDQSYFWIDRSRPGRRGRPRRMLTKAAATADQRARTRRAQARAEAREDAREEPSERDDE